MTPRIRKDHLFGATITCKHCKKRGHYEANCWFKYPDKRPKGKGSSNPKSQKGGGPPANSHGGGRHPTPNVSAPSYDFSDKGPPAKKGRVCLFGGNRVWSLNAQVNGRNISAIIDSGATVSVIAKRLVSNQELKREDLFPVQVANGETVYTLGSTILSMTFDDKLFEQKAQVMDTHAFDAVLGLDFLSGNPRCGGILTQPPPEKLLFDGKLFPLQSAKVDGTSFLVNHIHRIFKKESYTLIEEVKFKALEVLQVSRSDFAVDPFANHYNKQEGRHGYADLTRVLLDEDLE